MRFARWIVPALLASSHLSLAQEAQPAQVKQPTIPGVSIFRLQKDSAQTPGLAPLSESQSPSQGKDGTLPLFRPTYHGPRKQYTIKIGQPQAESAKSQSSDNKGQIVTEIDTLVQSASQPSEVHTIDGFGFACAETDAVLRSQLKLADDQGLVVVTVTENGLADQAGLKTNDLLLKLNNQNVAKVDQVREMIAKVGTGAISVDLIRGGKTRQLSLVGPDHGTPVKPASYWIGVFVAPVDATLRSHLTALPANSGLIATDVVADAPASKSGLRLWDILVKFNGQPLANQEAMVAEIQKSAGQPIAVELLRGGQPITLQVSPEQRAPDRVVVYHLRGNGPKQAAPFSSIKYLQPWLSSGLGENVITIPAVGPGWETGLAPDVVAYINNLRSGVSWPATLKTETPPLETQIKELTGRIQELQKSMDELAKRLSQDSKK